MGVMYNSQCVLNHPSGPEEAAQCITVNAELRGAVCVLTLTQEYCLQNNKPEAQIEKEETSSAVCKNLSQCANIYTFVCVCVRKHAAHYTHT